MAEVLLAACTDGKVSIRHAFIVDIGIQLHIHGTMSGIANHVGEPFNLSHCAEVIEAVFALGDELLVDNATESAETCSRIKIVVILCTAALGIGINDRTLRCTVAIVVSNSINRLARNGQGNGVRIREVLSERMSIGISTGNQIATQRSVQQVADFTAVQRVCSCVSGMFALEIACAMESVIAVGNRTVSTTEELVAAIQNTDFCNVQAVPHLGITTGRPVPPAESRTFVDSINATGIHAVLHIEIRVLVTTCAYHTSCSGSRGECCIAHAVENLKTIGSTSIGLDKADNGTDTVLTLDRASAIHDDVLNLSVTANEAEETKCLIIRAVNHQIADSVELTIELTSELVSIYNSSAFICVTANGSVVNTSQVDVGSQNCLSRESGCCFFCR